MRIVLVGLIVAGLMPLVMALRANRRTTLFHAIVWAVIAWLSWGLAFSSGELDRTGMEPVRYCALGLTGCAGVAVLGARRPHVVAWNFVVLGLFGVMGLPLVESQFLGTDPVDALRIFFLTVILAVGILNYLPTRLAPAAFLLLLCCGAEMIFLFAPESCFGEAEIVHILLTTAPWIAWLCLLKRGPSRSEFDQLWLDFRDRWGFVWGQRLREQFNNAAQHSGWPVKLYWQGLVPGERDAALTPEERKKMLETLRAALQRFIGLREWTD
jgi:hypothetical protein